MKQSYLNLILLAIVVVLVGVLGYMLYSVSAKKIGKNMNTATQQPMIKDNGSTVTPTALPKGVPPPAEKLTITIDEAYANTVKQLPMGSAVTIVNATKKKLTYATKTITQELPPGDSFVIQLMPIKPGYFYTINGLGEEKQLVIVPEEFGK